MSPTYPSRPQVVSAAPARKGRRVRTPRIWPIQATDFYALLAGNALLIGGMWVRHGGLEALKTVAGMFTAAGELTALYGTYLILIQLVLMSRSPFLDQIFGQDTITAAHRWVGFGAIWLIVLHAVFTTIGFAMSAHVDIVGETVTLLTSYPYVLWSAVGLAMFIVVGFTSMRAARRKLSYETWYYIHLYTYLAIALAFLHQLFVGIDFVSDPVAQGYWIALYAVAIGLMIGFRFAQPVYISAKHQFRLANAVAEGPGVVSLYVTGRSLEELPVRAGQWFRLRFLTGEGWWRAHPFSISAAPNGKYLRFTIKELGDYTQKLQEMTIGTRVFLEGPYGAMTAAARTRTRVLLIAGGIGITPLRALMEELPAARGNLILVYRATNPNELVFRREIDELASLRGAQVHYLVGKRGSREMPMDPLEPRSLRRLVPDIQERDIYVCGPTGMMNRVISGLRWLRIPAVQIHYERFGF
jgi:predicted ferric reductase